MEVIERHDGDLHLIAASEHFKSYNSFKKKLNKHLKKAGKAIGIDGVTTYVMRHTWATIAAKIEIPKETISAALGHSEAGVTDVYIDFDKDKVTKANRAVIDYLKRKGDKVDTPPPSSPKPTN